MSNKFAEKRQDVQRPPVCKGGPPPVPLGKYMLASQYCWEFPDPPPPEPDVPGVPSEIFLPPAAWFRPEAYELPPGAEITCEVYTANQDLPYDVPLAIFDASIIKTFEVIKSGRNANPGEPARIKFTVPADGSQTVLNIASQVAGKPERRTSTLIRGFCVPQ